MKWEFILVFNNSQYCPYVTSKFSDKKTMIPWKNFLKKVIEYFKDKGYLFNHLAEMHIMTEAHKMDMSYNFHNKHNMQAVEWKLNAMINKNKNLFNKLDRNWRHPLN